MKAFFFFLFIPYGLLSQTNLVLNPSFETFSPTTKDCIFTKDPALFNTLVPNWNTFDLMTPDLIVNKTKVECGYGSPQHGEAFVAMINYLPDEDVFHNFDYHEMLQGSLSKPLTAGKTYYISYWISQENKEGVHHLKSIYGDKTPVEAAAVGNFGFAFLENKLTPRAKMHEERDYGTLKPTLNHRGIIRTKEGQWIRMDTSFVAIKAYKYFVFGNFFYDHNTPTDFKAKEQVMNSTNKVITDFDRLKHIGYYRVDNFYIGEVPLMKEDAFANATEKTPYTCKNVTFDSGSSEIKIASTVELNALVRYLLANEEKKVIVAGHTDNVGNSAENMILSLNRAIGIQQYCVIRGIETGRIEARGMGDSQPIESNETEEGRSKNRRVTFAFY